MNKNRIVITGIGSVTSVGNTVPETWAGLLSGKSGIDLISRFDTSGFSVKIAAEVKNFDPTQIISSKEARRLDPFCHYALAASHEAIVHSGLEIDKLDLTRVGTLIGSGIGGIATLENQVLKLSAEGPSRVSPFLVPMMIGDMASGAVSIKYGFKGPNFGVVSACATGTHTIGEAFHILKRGHADVVVTGGSEACVTPISLAGFSAMKALSVQNQNPAQASRPFDAQRSGFVLGEGAGVIVLETLDHATRRNADILAEIIGYAASADAYHITSPDPENRGAIQALKIVMEESNLNPNNIDYINAHGTGTLLNDRNETNAIKKVLGDTAYSIPVTSTKSLTGHALGAAGAIESIICIKSICDNIIPGTYNYENKDPECDLDYVPNKSLNKDVNIALNLNFGFGGHNAVIALKHYEN